MKVVKKVSKRLDNVLKVGRNALIFEGTGVPHVHAKLFPLHGYLGQAMDIDSNSRTFYEEYQGYLTTLGGPKMDDKKLDELRDKLKF